MKKPTEYEYRGFKYRYIKSTGKITLFYEGNLVTRDLEMKRDVVELVDYLIKDMETHATDKTFDDLARQEDALGVILL